MKTLWNKLSDRNKAEVIAYTFYVLYACIVFGVLILGKLYSMG